jgi:hypothetical protein
VISDPLLVVVGFSPWCRKYMQQLPGKVNVVAARGPAQFGKRAPSSA